MIVLAFIVSLLTAEAQPAPIPAPEARAKRTAVAAEPAPKAAPVGGVWERLAQCESDGRWSYNGSSGFDGGLQFHPGTWTAFKSDADPAYAYQASKAAQVRVAKRVLAAQGWGAWPACAAKLGLR